MSPSIQSDCGTALSVKFLLMNKSTALTIESLDFSMQTNISAADTMTSTYADLCTTLTDIRESLVEDAGHIGQLAMSFAAVDSALSKQIEALP